MNIQVIESSISLADLKIIAEEFYGSMVKGVVDIERGLVVFGGEYHADGNELLLRRGSKQSDVWGFNVYFEKPRDSWIEYISLINIRPQMGNMSMEVWDENIRKKIKEITDSKII